eukprot:1158892-Pelagomonas_calceolata.AAC.11
MATTEWRHSPTVLALGIGSPRHLNAAVSCHACMQGSPEGCSLHASNGLSCLRAVGACLNLCLHACSQRLTIWEPADRNVYRYLMDIGGKVSCGPGLISSCCFFTQTALDRSHTLQDMVLFNDTIYYNIAYGDLNAPKEKVGISQDVLFMSSWRAYHAGWCLLACFPWAASDMWCVPPDKSLSTRSVCHRQKGCERRGDAVSRRSSITIRKCCSLVTDDWQHQHQEKK